MTTSMETGPDLIKRAIEEHRERSRRYFSGGDFKEFVDQMTATQNSILEREIPQALRGLERLFEIFERALVGERADK